MVVCTPSGKDAFGNVMYFLIAVALSTFLVIKGFSNPYQWLWLLLSIPFSFVFYFLIRYEFFGEEQIGIDGNDLFVKRVKGLVRETRIPLMEIKEIGIPYKSKVDQILEVIRELNMRSSDESSIEITTISGKTYRFGDDLSPQEVEYLIRQLMIEIAKMK